MLGLHGLEECLALRRASVTLGEANEYSKMVLSLTPPSRKADRPGLIPHSASRRNGGLKGGGGLSEATDKDGAEASWPRSGTPPPAVQQMFLELQ